MLSERSNRETFDLMANTEFAASEDPGFAGGLDLFAASGKGFATGEATAGAESQPGTESSLPAGLFRPAGRPLVYARCLPPLPVEEIGLYDHELLWHTHARMPADTSSPGNSEMQGE